MSSALRLKVGRFMLPIPRIVWQRRGARSAREITAGLSFMSADHHRVRNLVVTEVGRTGAAMSPEEISERLRLAPDRVDSIVGELERALTFLYRSDGRTVDWAYPVTATETPHHLTFESGERMTAA